MVYYFNERLNDEGDIFFCFAMSQNEWKGLDFSNIFIFLCSVKGKVPKKIALPTIEKRSSDRKL